jgi:serine/threonine protein kinase
MVPATRFGPYEIIRPLGKSMNDVYLAMDTRENRQAALKLIKAGPDATSRLVREAERRGAAIQQSLRALDPRVIEVYDYGDLDGYFFVAMQYVEGRNLAEALARDGRMSALRAARIALEICGQLEKFHTFQPEGGVATSVVHGDIKPSNIHLGLNETVRLLDFGIAKTLRPNHDFTFHNFGSPGYSFAVHHVQEVGGWFDLRSVSIRDCCWRRAARYPPAHLRSGRWASRGRLRTVCGQSPCQLSPVLRDGRQASSPVLPSTGCQRWSRRVPAVLSGCRQAGGGRLPPGLERSGRQLPAAGLHLRGQASGSRLLPVRHPMGPGCGYSRLPPVFRRSGRQLVFVE